jgi:hypothetical protein
LCPIKPFEEGYILNLEVKARDRDKDPLIYKYSVSGGEIFAEGSQARWDLRKAGLGRQTVVVQVTDGRGGKTTRRSEINVVEHGACDPGCSVLTVTCPTNVNESDTAVFVASVSGEDLPRKLIYLWSHSNGKRIAGDQGSKLRIKAVGLPGDLITVTVRVLGLDPACNSQASCESRIVKRMR